MRAFIAIELPVNIKNKLGEIISGLKECDSHAKWVASGNLHITLKFLGEISEEQLTEIKTAVQSVAEQFNPFTVNLKEFGFFPNEKRPRVFFVSTDNEDVLTCIASSLENILEKTGFVKENRFKSHITLARFKETKNADHIKKETDRITVEESFKVGAVSVFKSTLTKTGAIYEEIFKIPLKTER